MSLVTIDGQSLDLGQVIQIAREKIKVRISAKAVDRMRKSRECIEKLIDSGKIIYGVNTGFGKLADVHIPPDEIEELQLNLVLSHSCGIGLPIPSEIVRTAMALKANSLCAGYSGSRPEITELLISLLNKNIVPVIPQKGSVGASGDLAPLAHMTLVMLGLGEAWIDSKRVSGAKALKLAGLEPAKLGAKEGLALLNGTQILTAYAAIALYRAKRLIKLADIAGAISVESLLHSQKAFDPRIQNVRGYEHQIKVGKNFNRLLAESEIDESHKNCGKVQDAYSSRCIPQVHGGVRTALEYIENVVTTEINAVTDNPLVFIENSEVLSGGNFHGQPVALACDTLSIACSQLANISERRLANLLDSNHSNLPAFLVTESGTNSGFMIPQVTAAALVSENKVLSHPASVDSIPTSANQEDFVSMGTFAARKALEIVENAETVIGIELLAGCQAMDFRKNLKPGKGTGPAFEIIRKHIPPVQKDRLLQKDIEKIKELIFSNIIVDTVEQHIGPL
jgi:histidine ammonia-lyase